MIDNMTFIVEGRKSYPNPSYLSETDLLTLPRKNIKARQRGLNAKSLVCFSWENLFEAKYGKAAIRLKNVFPN